jgi:predicted  nucleic acid-binding Zn-ribbon protein
MTAPILQIAWLHRRPFLLVMCLTFLAFATVIFTLPTRVAVRSSIEIGSAVINDKQEPFEPPEQVARRIPNVYGPSALLAMASRGISSSVLNALQNPSVESVGRAVVVISMIDPIAENAAKEFQQSIADTIIKDLAPRAQALRENIAAQLALATKASDSLEQQIKADTNEIERISALSDDLRGQLDNQRANLTALYQRTGTALQSGESTMVEAQIRELHEQISSQTTLIGNLTLERSHLTRELAAMRHQYEGQARAVADAQYERNSFVETHISLPPSLLPGPTASRRLSLLLVALAISVLAGFGTVVLLHNMAGRSI